MRRERVLQVNIENTGGNGAFSLVQYLYKYLNEEFIFDYFSMSDFTQDKVYDEIITKGGKCYSASLRKNKLLGHIRLPFVFYKYLKQNNYSIIHIHSEVAYKHFLYGVAARCAGIKKIIIHSHSSSIDGDKKGFKYFCHSILRLWVNKLGTDFLACSEPAAKWMFTKKTLEGDHFRLLHNGIAPKEYVFSKKRRDEKRKELRISSKVVLGHVGALKKVKNQERLLEIVKVINDEKFVLLLIGDGEDKNKLLDKVRTLGIEKQVLFLGSRTDVSDLLQAIDVLVFPSFFEGIPMALIEAQAAGIPIVASDTINRDIKINKNVSFVSLKANNVDWIRKINEALNQHIKEEGNSNVLLSDYNIENSANELRKVYLNV